MSTPNTNVMTREQVFALINEERDYQERKWGRQSVDCQSHSSSGRPSLETEFLILEEYMSRARAKWVDSRGNESLKDLMRIIAATAVRAGEIHGMSARTPPQVRPNITAAYASAPLINGQNTYRVQ